MLSRQGSEGLKEDLKRSSILMNFLVIFSFSVTLARSAPACDV